MKITKVYLDLKEAKPEERFWKNVWVLESEAFKDPLVFQMEYEPSDLQRLKEQKSEVESKIEEFQKILDKEHEHVALLEWVKNKLKDELKAKDEKIEEVQELVDKHCKAIKQLSTSLDNQSEALEKRVDKLTHLEERTKELEKKLTKQPKVIHDTTFLSWIWQSYLGMIDIPDGEYLVIRQTQITEKNEFVANDDELIFDRIHINWWYAPEYILKGTDAVSTPTATIDRTLVFIPI